MASYALSLRSIIADMEVVDDYTILIDTGEPNALTIPWLSNWAMPILPEHLIRDPNPGPGDTGWVWMQPRVDDPDFGKGTGTLGIGTGPYIMTTWESEGWTAQKRNPNYWLFDEFGQRLPYLDGVVSKYTADLTRHFAEFATGSTHQLRGGAGLSQTKAEMLCGRRPDACRTNQAEHGFFYIILNDRIPPFDDPKAREGARWALNVHKTAYVPFGQVGNHGQWMHPLFSEATLTSEELYSRSPWLNPDERTFLPPDQWQDKAREQFAEIGYTDGLEMAFPWYMTTRPIFRDMQGLMATDMRAAGAKFQVAASGGATNDELRAGLFNIALSSCGSPLVDPTGAVAMGALAWSSAVGRRPWAWPGVEESTAMYDEAAKVTDVIKRGELLRDMERWYLDSELSVFAQVWTYQVTTIPDCVKNFVLGPGLYGSKELSHTWMSDDGLCKKQQETDLQRLEPTDMNVVQGIMWNWQ
jgi:ABC-type transport system substrate-binding protein